MYDITNLNSSNNQAELVSCGTHNMTDSNNVKCCNFFVINVCLIIITKIYIITMYLWLAESVSCYTTLGQVTLGVGGVGYLTGWMPILPASSQRQSTGCTFTCCVNLCKCFKILPSLSAVRIDMTVRVLQRA